MNSVEDFVSFEELKKHEYTGKRENVVCGKISAKLNEAIRQEIGKDHYGSLNDFVEEAVMEKMIRINWAKIDNGGIKRGN